MLPPQSQVKARGEGRKQYAESLVKILVLAQEGRKRKLDETPAFKIQSTIQTSNLLAARTIEQLNQENTVAEADMRKYYEEHRGDFEQVRGSHILIRMQGSPVPVRPGQKDITEEEALAKAQVLHKKLVAGQDFGGIAREESDDTQSGAQGGDLGVFRRNQMVPAFEEVAFQLKPGELSAPLKTQFGYHLIRVDSRQNVTFEEAKPDIERRMKPEVAQKILQDLEKKGNAVYDPEFFGLPKQ
jgi:peptidyl-prolyl cis-trans isomerase C